MVKSYGYSYWGDDFLLCLCGVGRALDLEVYANSSVAHILLRVQSASQWEMLAPKDGTQRRWLESYPECLFFFQNHQPRSDSGVKNRKRIVGVGVQQEYNFYITRFCGILDSSFVPGGYL